MFNDSAREIKFFQLKVILAISMLSKQDDLEGLLMCRDIPISI